MHTFSCAVQSVDVEGTTLRFEADPGDYHVCRLVIEGHAVVTFSRNGLVTGVEPIEAAPVADEPSAPDISPTAEEDA